MRVYSRREENHQITTLKVGRNKPIHRQITQTRGCCCISTSSSWRPWNCPRGLQLGGEAARPSPSSSRSSLPLHILYSLFSPIYFSFWMLMPKKISHAGKPWASGPTLMPRTAGLSSNYAFLNRSGRLPVAWLLPCLRLRLWIFSLLDHK